MSGLKSVVDFDPVALHDAVARLERRVTALEAQVAQIATPGSASAAVPLEEAPLGSDWSFFAAVTLAGRTLIAIGGAYLLRALTEGDVLPLPIGTALGLAYAGLWIWLLATPAGAATSASRTFHGVSATLIGFPLIWEATTRFAVVTPRTSAAVLGLFSVLLLLGAHRGRVEAVAWLGTLGGLATAVGLAIATAAWIPFTMTAASIGIATLWLGYLDEWTLLRWPAAFVVNCMVLLTTSRALVPHGAALASETVTLQLVVLASYFASFVTRALFRGREVIAFEFAQGAAAMAACFGGAVWVLVALGVDAGPLGVAALVLGVAAYAFALVLLERRHQARNVIFFTSVGLAFVLAGAALLLAPAGVAVLAGAVALGLTEWSRRSGRILLAVHGLLCAAVLVVVSGLAGVAARGLVGAGTQPWPVFAATTAVALLVVIVVAAFPLPKGNAEGAVAEALRVARLTLLVALAAGAVTIVLVPVVTTPGAGADHGLVASVRTLVLVAAAAALAVRGRRGDRAARWVANGLLAAIALKLFVEDLPRGRPATLFVALAVYGAALILIPRAWRNGGVTVAPPADPRG